MTHALNLLQRTCLPLCQDLGPHFRVFVLHGLSMTVPVEGTPLCWVRLRVQTLRSQPCPANSISAAINALCEKVSGMLRHRHLGDTIESILAASSFF